MIIFLLCIGILVYICIGTLVEFLYERYKERYTLGTDDIFMMVIFWPFCIIYFALNYLIKTLKNILKEIIG